MKLEIEVKGAASTRRQLCKFGQNDSLYDASGLPAYKDFIITDINPLTNTVYFMNGDKLRRVRLWVMCRNNRYSAFK